MGSEPIIKGDSVMEPVSTGSEIIPKQPRKQVTMDEVSRIIWTQCFGARLDEKAVIVADKQRMAIARSLLDTGREYCDCSTVMVSGMSMNGQEPSESVANAMLDADIVIAPTTFSLTHTEASLKATENGARVISMPGITREMFLRAIPVDYRALCATGDGLIEKMRGREVKVTTRAGTDMYLRIDGRAFHNYCGVIQKAEPGKILNLPDGEICVAPLEGRGEGKVVIDVSSAPSSETPFGVIGRVKKPFTVRVDGGEVVDCENDVLWKVLTSVQDGTNLAELGIGTNPKAQVTGRILEDEKILGTAHFGFGTNKDLGGVVQSSVHIDAVFWKPSIEVDGELVVMEGKF